MMLNKVPYRCGYVSIVGRPNAGKSTLLNLLVGEKLSIVADKPQTTRTLVQGVVTREEAQIVFLDTPGLHDASSKINQRLMDAAMQALEERDVIILVADATRPFSAGDEKVLNLVKNAGAPVLLVLNKIDLVTVKPKLLELLTKYQEQYEFAEYLPLSAFTSEGIGDLWKAVIGRLPEGEAIFPDDYLTDQPERFLAAELVREKVLHHTHNEVPHSVTVFVEAWEDNPTITRISATIYVERPGQKAIVIGKQGQMLKAIGSEARQDIERMLERKVFLELYVKVSENWRESTELLRSLDWRSVIQSKSEED